MRYFVELAFNGRNYHGWQKQPNAISVQEAISAAFSILLKEKVELTGCGRTDTGVHATQFVAHFDSSNEYLHQDNKIIYQLNSVLPNDIAIYSLRRVVPDAHSRFSAIERCYQYFIRHDKDPFRNDYSYFMGKAPDYESMNIAAVNLLSITDFTSFCKMHGNNETNICKVFEANWKPIEKEYVFTISADRFLRNMVRAIVGTLLEVGLKKITQDQFMDIIHSRDRSVAGKSVPGHGLYLSRIKYKNDIYLDKKV